MKKNMLVLASLLSVLALSACGGGDGFGDSDPDVTIANPSERLYPCPGRFGCEGGFEGLSFLITIESGSNLYASTGSVIIDFISDSEYAITGDQRNIPNSYGTYSLNPLSFTKIDATYMDSIVGRAIFRMVWNNYNSGTFSASITSDPDSHQTGHFRLRD